MRVDQKAEGPRQSMSWLHTWASLILGWLLYAIFVTGTLSFFQNEISTWMKPETHQSIPAQSQVQQMQVALNYLQKNHPDAGSWNIQLPNSRQTTTEVTIRAVGEDPKARRGGTRITLDSATGEVIEPRDTRGGGFLYRFHFELYGLPRLWTRWLVGIATMFMLVAIVSGIITHKKIFKDFFTFRSGKDQRSWLDAHNATAVFALPFHLMITFSGLLLLMFMFMPWGINQAYENRQQFLRDQQASMIEQLQKAEDQQREGRGQREGERAARGERGQQRGEHAQGRGKERPSQPELRPAPLTDLAPIMVAVQQQWKDNPIASINIISPNTDQAKIELRALRAESVAHRNVYATINYNGVTGQDETDKNIRIKNPSIPSGIYNVVTVLHEARGLDLALRWLLFCSGILGTLMVATGLILWCVKRAPQQQKQGYKSFGFRLVEVLNIAAIIGLPLACAAYFYANRFIPTDVEMRLNWEIRSFFTVWLLTLIYAIFRTHRQAWLDLLLLATLAFALLPVVNLMTGGQALWNSIAQGQWMIASVDLAMWVMAVIFYFAYNKVKKLQGLPNKKVKAPVQEAKA